MKKIIAILVITVSLISFSSHAQTSNAATGKHSAERMKQMLKDSLHLTDVQIDSVISIREEFAGRMKEITANASLSQDQKKEQLKPLRQEMKERMKPLLTKDQLQQVQRMQQEMHKGKQNDDTEQ